MPRPDRDYRATTSCECRTALLTSHSAPGLLGHADAESFQETALPRRGDHHRVRSFVEVERDLTNKQKTITAVTGAKLGWGGASEYYGVTPDMICLAKSIGGGFPLSGVISTIANIVPREMADLAAALDDIWSGRPLANRGEIPTNGRPMRSPSVAIIGAGFGGIGLAITLK